MCVKLIQSWAHETLYRLSPKGFWKNPKLGPCMYYVAQTKAQNWPNILRNNNNLFRKQANGKISDSQFFQFRLLLPLSPCRLKKIIGAVDTYILRNGNPNHQFRRISAAVLPFHTQRPLFPAAAPIFDFLQE